tara:strand:- start:192 stop:614 length:423 start_codon:yes stop_codon:yes gene_type:complete
MRKNKTTKNFTNFKMDGDVYLQRCKVMSVIYAVKKSGMNIPRIDVRIGEDKNCHVLGKGRLNDNIIWITPKAINKDENYLYHTVLHELVHTIFGKGHSRTCHLMKAYQPEVVFSKDKLIKLFRRYYDLWINKQTKQLEVA